MLSGLIGWWSDLYLDHRWLSVTIRFLHLAALLVGGGTALFFDRRVLAARRADAAARQEVFDALHGIHPLVVSALTVIGFTGVLMTLVDTEVFLGSTVYWTKMSLVVLLAANGLLLLAAEKRAGRIGAEAAWPRLVLVSGMSIVLWLAVLFMGTLLQVAA
jgi:uncharacterized membrane-anchored protein